MSTPGKPKQQSRVGIRGPHAEEVVGILPSRGHQSGTAHPRHENKDALAEEIEEMALEARSPNAGSGRVFSQGIQQGASNEERK